MRDLPELSYDERTMQKRSGGSSVSRKKSLLAKMRQFVEEFYLRKGMKHKANMVANVASDAEEIGEAPVLKPRKNMRYHFSA